MTTNSKQTIDTLEKVGKLLIQCRVIPSPVFERIGDGLSNCDHGLSIKDFHIVPEPVSDCHPSDPDNYKTERGRNDFSINPKGHKFHAWVLLRNTMDIPRKPVLTMYAYGRYKRYNLNGGVGEQIQAIPCYLLGESMEYRLSNLWVCCNPSEPILEIGVNENYDPDYSWSKKGAVIKRYGTDTLRIKSSVPVFDSYLEPDEKRIFDVPLKDAEEILNRFATLLQTYEASTQPQPLSS